MDGHGIIYSIIVGFLAGLLARAIMPGDQKAGFIITVLLGIVGSWVANFLGSALGWYAPGSATGLFGSVIGAVIILAVFGFIRKSTTKGT